VDDQRDTEDIYIYDRLRSDETGPDIEPGIYVDTMQGEMITIFAGTNAPGRSSVRRLPARFRLAVRLEPDEESEADALPRAA
jgi:hypothetical protein